MDILTALVPLIVPILLPIIIAGSAATYQYLVQRSPANVHSLVTNIAQTSVQGVEQYYSSEVKGDSKKLAAQQAVNMMLSHMKVSASPALVNAAIEAAVYSMKQEQVLFAPRETNTSSIPAPTPEAASTVLVNPPPDKP